MAVANEAEVEFSLLWRAGTMLCALSVAHVVEIMRPLPMEVLPNAPGFVAGMAVVRGQALPVVALNRLLGDGEQPPERLIIVRAGTRRIGLLVDTIVGLRASSSIARDGLPPLLAEAARDAVAEIGTLDGELLLVLETARLVPAEVFTQIESEALAS